MTQYFKDKKEALSLLSTIILGIRGGINHKETLDIWEDMGYIGAEIIEEEEIEVDKIKFESEEQARKFYKDTISGNNSSLEDCFISILKQKGYIEKSELEEKKEMYNTKRGVFLNNRSADEYIVVLQKENERLKGVKNG